MNSLRSHSIKHRAVASDCFDTPPKLAQQLISLVPLAEGNKVIDPAMGSGVFFNNFPAHVRGEGFDILQGVDFLKTTYDADWLITNPPYSCLDRWLEHSTHARIGFAYLIGQINLTPRRIEAMEKAGFGLTTIYVCKVFKYFGISYFCIWIKGKRGILSYDRVVWR